ncbi:MAG TPA: polysaccharide deacetylase family protein [Thermomicrobiales bacterium]|nr:polysaccharide deacetylase family protein [Thermomicrobiales bacterium]
MANFPWPDGKRCAVALTFDMDGECVPMIYDPQNYQKRLSLQSEGTYGPNVGVPRILDLLDRHGIQATFFVPGFTAERHPDLLREMIARGHEVGHHGYLHERPDFVDEAEEERIMVRGLEVLESITGRRPRGYRSPTWELKPTSPALLKKYGFVYDTSLMGDDEPYLIDAGDEKLLEIPIQWMNDDWAYFRLLLDSRARQRHFQPASGVRNLVGRIRRLSRRRRLLRVDDASVRHRPALAPASARPAHPLH